MSGLGVVAVFVVAGIALAIVAGLVALVVVLGRGSSH